MVRGVLQTMVPSIIGALVQLTLINRSTSASHIFFLPRLRSANSMRAVQPREMGQAMCDILIPRTSNHRLHNLVCCDACTRSPWFTVSGAVAYSEVALHCSRVRLTSSHCSELFCSLATPGFLQQV